MNLEKLFQLLPGARVLKCRYLFAIVLILLAQLAIKDDTSYAAGRVFYDSFESGNTSQWLQDDFRNRCPVVTASIDGIVGPYAGSRMLRCNSNPTIAYNDPNSYETLSLGTDSLYNNEVFIRTRVRVDKNMSVQQKLLRFFETPGSLYHDLFDVAGHPQNAFNNAGNTTTQTMPTYWGEKAGDNTNLTTGWHKVEYYIQQSTGTVKVWHDGILVRNNVSLNFDNLKWRRFYITSNGDAGDSTNHIYFDEFEIYSDKGTGASGLMSDATIIQGGSAQGVSTGSTPPPAPQNLTIQNTQ